jgi:hypothetical protein
MAPARYLSIMNSSLHQGQNNGNDRSRVCGRTFVLVAFRHLGQSKNPLLFVCNAPPPLQVNICGRAESNRPSDAKEVNGVAHHLPRIFAVFIIFPAGLFKMTPPCFPAPPSPYS